MRRWLRPLGLVGLISLIFAACDGGGATPAPGVDAGARQDAPREDDAALPADAPQADAPVVDAPGSDAPQDDAAPADAAPADAAQSDAPACMDECQQGSRTCDGDSQFRVCGQYDLDSCVELSPPVNCVAGYACVGDRCVPPCRDECPAGSTACASATSVVVCGNFDADACLELGGAVDCAAGDRCEKGACVPAATVCTDECTAGGTACFGDAVRTCGHADGDSCLDLGPPVACASGEVCRNGSCVAYCTDECPAAGARECLGDAYRECGNHDADACLEWGASVACGAGESCSGGQCAAGCTNDCTVSGTQVCPADNRGVSLCGQFDSDPCLDRSTPIPCPLGTACQDGICVASCISDCTLGQAARCGTDNRSLETCGNFDSDVCYELGGAVACPGGAACSNGACEIPCTHDCTTAGEKKCSADHRAVLTCGQNDLDPCREWSTPSPCQAWEVCQSGICALGATPATILVNEIVYDSVGTDTAAGNGLFIELWGPPGQSLDGYDIAGVDGNNGAAYVTIPLDGEVVGSDGYFLIAHPSGAADLVALADITATAIDFQNGPDSVQVRWHGRVIDALGYGTFGAGTQFAGEGQAAAATGAGKSLTRDASHTDTGDNAVDFAVPAAPSPRAAAGCVHACSTLTATRCNGTQVETCVTDADTDPCREWSAAANCPTLGHVCTDDVCGPPPCNDECGPLDATQCSGDLIQTCVTNADADACREWAPAQACSTAGQVCRGNACTIPCDDECPQDGAKQCSGDRIQTCVRHADADSCLEWSTAADCPNAAGGEVCRNDVCTIPCNDECPGLYVTQCAGAQVRTCAANHDGDACLEWGPAANCDPGLICRLDTCQNALAPEVVLITPVGTLQTTQGNSHRVLVDATAAAGRSIVQVDYIADGAVFASTTNLPHETNYTVPSAAATGSRIALQAMALDSLGLWGSSGFAFLEVKNDTPVAAFTATITNVDTVTVDAGAATDTETPTASLQVCWDWDNDGTCDTPWSATKIATHGGYSAGTHTIRMKVQDAVGQISETTRDVTFADIQYIGGVTLQSTLWYGTIIVTGDVTVAPGQTLTIADGTQVLFVRDDTNPPDGTGDHTLDVQGALVVDGTEQRPVTFTGQDAAAKTPGSWDRILLTGAGSSLTWAVIEYADVGLETRTNVTLSNVTVRSTKRDCIYLNNADSSTLTDVTVTLCGESGVKADNGSTAVTLTRLSSTVNGHHGLSVLGSSSVTATASTLAGNTRDGARTATASTFNLADSTVESNTGIGLAYVSTSGGTVQRNEIRLNQAEGVRLLSDATGNPNPVINTNNIHSNAATASTNLEVVDPSATLTASYGSWGSGTSSPTWNVPAGTTVHRVLVVYSEPTTWDCIFGYLQRADTGANLATFSSSTGGTWVYVGDPGVRSLRVRVADSCYGAPAETITATQVELLKADGTFDIVAITAGGTADLRYNYAGTFPNVLSRVKMARTTALNLQGFVGVLYDSSWSRGPYKAGPLTTEDWSGTIYVTGDISIAAGQAVTAVAGTQIQFVDHDQNEDGQGDFALTASGRLDLAGVAGTPVVVTGHGNPSGDDYQSITLAGSAADASTWTYVDVAYGKTPIIVSGASRLTNVTVTGGSDDGIRLTSSTGATLTDVHVTGAGAEGVQLTNADNATLTRLTVDANTGDGLYIDNGSSGVTVSRLFSSGNTGRGLYIAGGSTPVVNDSTLRDNGSHGVHVVSSSPDIDYNLIVYNGGAGLRIEGSGAPTAEYNIIKFNDDAGASIWSTSAGSPMPTLQYSNIYANAVLGTTMVSTEDTSATLTASYGSWGSGVSSGVWSAPANTAVRRVYINYSEPTTWDCIYGYLQRGDTGATLQTFSSSFSGWVYVTDPTVTSLRVRVADSCYGSPTETITATQVELTSFSSSSHYELAAMTDAGTTTAKFNFWTSVIGDVPGKIFQARPMSVDYTGYTAPEHPSAGPRP